MALTGLTRVRCRVSSTISADLDSVWSILRDWQALSIWFHAVDNQPLCTSPVSGGPTELGGIRCIQIVGSRMYEQLVTLDDEEHILRWKLINHPDTVNPFSHASFLNYLSTIRLHEVTIGNATFLDWTAEFYTEAQFAASMEDKLTVWFAKGIQKLKDYMARNRLELASPQYSQMQQRVSAPAPSQAHVSGGSRPGIHSRFSWPPPGHFAGTGAASGGSSPAIFPTSAQRPVQSGPLRPPDLQQFPPEHNSRPPSGSHTAGGSPFISPHAAGLESARHDHPSGQPQQQAWGLRAEASLAASPIRLARTSAPASLQSALRQSRPQQGVVNSVLVDTPSFVQGFQEISIRSQSVGEQDMEAAVSEELMHRMGTDPGPGAAEALPPSPVASTPPHTVGFGSFTLLTEAAQQALRSSFRTLVQRNKQMDESAVPAQPSPFGQAQMPRHDATAGNGVTPCNSLAPLSGGEYPDAAGSPNPFATAAARQAKCSAQGTSGFAAMVAAGEQLPCDSTYGSQAGVAVAETAVGSKRSCELISAPSQPSSATETCTSYSRGNSSTGDARMSYDEVRRSTDDVRIVSEGMAPVLPPWHGADSASAHHPCAASARLQADIGSSSSEGGHIAAVGLQGRTPLALVRFSPFAGVSNGFESSDADTDNEDGR